MLDLLLIMGIILGGILTFIGFVFFALRKCHPDTNPETMIPPVVLVICVIWFVIACKEEIEYETKTYSISTINENTQVVDVDGELINVNRLLGKLAKPNEVLEVKKIKNHFRGGVYFTLDKTDYKLVKIQKEENEK